MPPSTPSPLGPTAASLTRRAGLATTELQRRLANGLPQIIVLALLGGAAAAFVTHRITRDAIRTTTAHLGLTFERHERGEYPDASPFRAEDILAKEIVAPVLQQQGLDPQQQETVRQGLAVTEVVSPSILRERDRLRANGQIPPVLGAEEESLTLTLPKSFPLSDWQCATILSAIVNAYRTQVLTTKARPPISFRNPFSELQTLDFPDYESTLTPEVQNLLGFLSEQAAKDKFFRSPTTQRTYPELLSDAQFFRQVRLNGLFSRIYLDGAARDRASILVRLDYQLALLQPQAKRAQDEDAFIASLLEQTRQRPAPTTVNVQAGDRAAGSSGVDSTGMAPLIVDDTYNFLVHRRLDAGLKLRQIQYEVAHVTEQRRRIATGSPEQVQQISQLAGELGRDYEKLLQNIGKTLSDDPQRRTADALRFVSQPTTTGSGALMSVALFSGLAIGGAIGAALSLCGLIWPARAQKN